MKDLTYLLPCRIETDDRLRNVITSVSYLLKNFPEAKVLVKEVDTKSQFIEFALPQIKVCGDIGQLKIVLRRVMKILPQNKNSK